MEGARDQVTATVGGKKRQISKMQATTMQLATKAAIGDQISPSSGPPGTEFLDAETGRQKQSAKRANARRDQNPGSERSEIPAETPYLASYRKRAACGDWMVGATEVPEISINNNLHEGQGDNGPLKRNGYFEDHPHLYRPSSPLAGRLSDV